MIDYPWNLPPEAAVAWFRARERVATDDWRDLYADEHALAFTVAGLADAGMLEALFLALDLAIDEGWSMAQFRERLDGLIEGAGWVGENPYRLNLVFRTNVLASYHEGRWQAADHQNWGLYDAVNDQRTRDDHRAWDGTLLPLSDPWWQTHRPPLGYNCRCSWTELSTDELTTYGLARQDPPADRWTTTYNPRTGETIAHPEGIEATFYRQPGESRRSNLERLLAERRERLRVA